MSVNVKEREFRRESDGEMYAHEIDGTRAEATLQGYTMLDPAIAPISKPLKNILIRLRQCGDRDASKEANDDKQKRSLADALSWSVKKAKQTIDEAEDLRGFVEPVAINTLRHWGEHDGCPIPLIYSHNGDRIAIGQSDYSNITVKIPKDIHNDIGRIDFWTPLEPRKQY